MKLSAKEVTVYALLGALLFLQQVVLSFLPNISLTTPLILVYTLVFGRRALYIIYMFVILEGAVFGFGLWFFGYLYIWLVPFGLALIFRRQQSPLFWAILAGGFGLCFGLLYAPVYGIVGGLSAAIASWISGIPFDLVHMVGDFFTTLLVLKPFSRILTGLNDGLERPVPR